MEKTSASRAVSVAYSLGRKKGFLLHIHVQFLRISLSVLTITCVISFDAFACAIECASIGFPATGLIFLSITLLNRSLPVLSLKSPYFPFK